MGMLDDNDEPLFEVEDSPGYVQRGIMLADRIIDENDPMNFDHQLVIVGTDGSTAIFPADDLSGAKTLYLLAACADVTAIGMIMGGAAIPVNDFEDMESAKEEAQKSPDKYMSILVTFECANGEEWTAVKDLSPEPMLRRWIVSKMSEEELTRTRGKRGDFQDLFYKVGRIG